MGLAIAALIALGILVYAVSGIGHLLGLTPTGEEVLDRDGEWLSRHYRGVVVGYILTAAAIAAPFALYFLARYWQRARPDDRRGLIAVTAGPAVALLLLVVLLPVGPRSGASEEARDVAQQPSRDASPDRSGRRPPHRKRPPSEQEKPERAPPVGVPGIPANAKRTTVSEVTDGDTVELAGVGASRLIGVDTPEVYFEPECFGARASAYTGRRLAPGTRVDYLFGAERVDDYGRALVYIWLGGGTFFNAELVREGYAVPLTIAPNDRFAGLFRDLARKARRAAEGLWSPSTCGGDPDLRLDRKRDGKDGGGGTATAGDKDCADFSSQSEAQRYFEAKGGPSKDPDRLDADHDGVACESL